VARVFVLPSKLTEGGYNGHINLWFRSPESDVNALVEVEVHFEPTGDHAVFYVLDTLYPSPEQKTLSADFAGVALALHLVNNSGSPQRFIVYGYVQCAVSSESSNVS